MRPAQLSREPLLWYTLAGAALFALHHAVAPPGPGTVTISADTEEALVARFTTQTRRAPTPEERARIVDAAIDEELLWREGQALGLVAADPVVRRRTVQQMRAIAEEAGGLGTPDDGALAALLAADPARYARPPRVAFTQVRVGLTDPALPDVLLARLRAGADPARLGEADLHGRVRPLTPLPTITRDYGAAFADALRAPDVGTWLRVDTADGAHLVRIDAWDPGGPATLDDVRERLAQDWTTTRRAENARAALAGLRARYVIERP